MEIFKGIFFALVWVGCVPQAYANPYDNNEDYAIHQKVSNLFFRKPPKNPATIAVLEKFQEEYARSSKVSRIELGGLSSRSRILLLYAISQKIFDKYNAEKASENLCKEDSFFEKSQQLGQPLHSKHSISYSFGKADFSVWYTPSERDPGSLLISGLTCNTLWRGLASVNTQVVADYFLRARLQQAPCGLLDHDRATIFLDFEIARRLMGNEEIPIASAIINFLKLSKKYSEYPLHCFFEEPTVEIEEVGFVDNSKNAEEISNKESDAEEVCFEEIEIYRGYNPFKGPPWIGKAATKNILTERYKKKEEKLEHKKSEAEGRLINENKEERREIKAEAKGRWLKKKAQEWWTAELNTLKEQMNSMKESKEKEEFKDSLECNWIVEDRKKGWIKNNQKALEDEYIITFQHYTYFGGAVEDDDYWEQPSN
ncbi:MAG: hypothetical protein K2W92_09890 [Alphaproteobacteria bacterium]|nr:hypothetical protein [Alphaproteobacteria bacterium]